METVQEIVPLNFLQKLFAKNIVMKYKYFPVLEITVGFGNSIWCSEKLNLTFLK